MAVSSVGSYDKSSALLVGVDSRIDPRYAELQVLYVTRTRAQMYVVSAH